MKPIGHGLGRRRQPQEDLVLFAGLMGERVASPPVSPSSTTAQWLTGVAHVTVDDEGTPSEAHCH